MTSTASSSHRILVVDDTATNRQILAVFLKKLGHVVELAEDGAQAVALFSSKPFDLVIMDVMMPVMDGYEATRRIKAICGERWVPVIFLSALDKDENLVTGLDAGGDDYLPKPVNFVVLEAKLRSLSRAIALRRELEESRAFSQAITDNLVDAIVIINEHGLIEAVNPACCRIFGFAESEMLGCNVSMLMPEPWRSAHDGYIARYLGGGMPKIIGMSSRELEGVHKDGSVFPISLSVSEFRDKGRRMFVGAVRDITQQKRAEQTLRENAATLQVYHDDREAENHLAAEILDQLMRRPGLIDPSLHYWMSPATNFSGDIVAASRANDGRYYVLLADATGHGLAAAISVLPVLTLFYDIVEFGLPLGRVVAKINSQLRVALPVGRFVCCSCLCIDPRQGNTELWFGGMPAALLIDGNGKIVREIASTHLPLGIDDFDWRKSATESLPPQSAGSQLLLMSDGLVEARNAADEEFGMERLQAALAGVPPAARIAALQDAVHQHLGALSPHDDVTVVLVDLPTAP
ncbi:MAG: SpoIIE family protein phosphatase [Rhodocyclaceae bacterium]|nr:SpoIIE family protein phosphatase [Rhodocyclaceae bacterium]MDZ4214778.1 SpoIIE family protein phosphatase [Rhodocyclaceae bacterium]